MTSLNTVANLPSGGVAAAPIDNSRPRAAGIRIPLIAMQRINGYLNAKDKSSLVLACRSAMLTPQQQSCLAELNTTNYLTYEKILSSQDTLGIRRGDWASLLKLCPRLEYLRLMNTEIRSDEGLAIIRALPPSVTRLDLCGCSWIDDRVLGVIAENARLRCLYLDECPHIMNGNAGLRLILQKNPSLDELTLSGNPWVNPETLEILAAHPNLDTLNLQDCQNMANEGLRVLVDGRAVGEIKVARGQRITDLQLTDNDWVDDVSLYMLSECRSLKTLGLRRCNHVSEGALVRLRRERPDIDIQT